LVREVDAIGWAASIENFKERFSKIPPCDALADYIGAVDVDSTFIALVVTIEDQGSVDVVPKLDNKFKRMTNLLCLNITDTSC